MDISCVKMKLVGSAIWFVLSSFRKNPTQSYLLSGAACALTRKKIERVIEFTCTTKPV